MKTAAADQCQHPKHKEYLVAFLKKYPTASKDAHFAINMVDPEEWWISDDQKKNTVDAAGCVVFQRILLEPAIGIFRLLREVFHKFFYLYMQKFIVELKEPCVWLSVTNSIP